MIKEARLAPGATEPIARHRELSVGEQRQPRSTRQPAGAWTGMSRPTGPNPQPWRQLQSASFRQKIQIVGDGTLLPGLAEGDPR